MTDKIGIDIMPELWKYRQATGALVSYHLLHDVAEHEARMQSLWFEKTL